jgi:6-phosphogluconolactonase
MSHRSTLATFLRPAVLPSFALAALAACSDQATEPPTTVPFTPSVAQSGDRAGEAGAVYTLTNATSGNAVLAFHRAADGSLTSLGSAPTGGIGTGGGVDPLQSQFAVILSGDNRLLLAVNAGSNDVTSFRVARDGNLEAADRAPSGGTLPVSLALHGSFLYVLNAGDNTVSGLRLSPTGKLTRLPHATRALASGAAGASTIHFDPDGDRLIVTERASSRLETLQVGPSGSLDAPVVTASSGATPFGFDVTRRGTIIVSEAGGAAPNGAVSSYDLDPSGALSPVTRSLDAQGLASCWVVATADGAFAFVANSATSAIAAVGVGADGSLQLLDAQAGKVAPGAAPIDLDLAAGDHFIYTLEAGSGSIGSFAVNSDGSLTPGVTVPAGAAASGLQGLAAF